MTLDDNGAPQAGWPVLDFWFEFASPYTYLAAMGIEDACATEHVRLRWRPFLLGPIFTLQGWNDSHFNLNKRRGDYMWRDMERLTKKSNLPWQKPSAFPRASTLAARIACANQDALWIARFARATFIANFGDDADIADPSVLTSILANIEGDDRKLLDAEAIIANASSPASRGSLRANTERAIELGIFGSPNFIVGSELYWGEEAVMDAIEFARASAITLKQ